MNRERAGQKIALPWYRGRFAMPLGAGCAAFVLYLLTMSPSWGFVDGGELSMVCSRADVAHPTGYPTATMLGYLAVQLVPGRDVFVLNGLAAFYTGLSVMLLALLLVQVLRMLRKDRGDDLTLYVPASLAALITGTGTIWWLQGTSFEVYSLHMVVTLAAAILFIRFVEARRRDDVAEEAGRSTGPETGGGRERRTFDVPLLGIVLGLGFTTHMTMTLWLPAYAIYYFGRLGFRRRSFFDLLKLLPWFLLGLLPYIYLPLRSSAGDHTMVGHLDSWDRFLWHVEGKMFQNHLFTGVDVFIQQCSWFFKTLPGEFAWAGLLPAVWGLAVCFRRIPMIAVWSVVLFATVVFWMSNYDILDVDAQFLPAVVMVGIWFGIGLYDLGRRFGSVAVAFVGAGLIGVNVSVHYAESDQSRNRYPEEMAHNVLNSLEREGIIFSDDWDFWLAGSLYAQKVEGVRPDVVVIYATLLHYDWYLERLERRYPELTKGLDSLSLEYRATVEAERNGDLPNGAAYKEMTGLVHRMIVNEIDRRPVYLGMRMDPNFAAPFKLVPNGMALRVVKDGGYLPQPFPSYVRTSSVDRIDPYVAMVDEMYARSLVARGLYEDKYGNPSLAERYLDTALTFDPGYDPEGTPDQPLNGELQIGLTASFFDRIRAMAGHR